MAINKRSGAVNNPERHRPAAMSRSLGLCHSRRATSWRMIF
jgi:hypothetical protein